MKLQRISAIETPYQDINITAYLYRKAATIECRWTHLSELPQYRELLRPRINYLIDFWHKNLAYPARK